MEYFDFFGLEPRFSIDISALKKAYYKASRATHPDHHAGADDDHVLDKSSNVNVAYKVLKDRRSRIKYILEQEGLINDAAKLSVPQEFLMEMMEINEALMELELDDSAETRATVEGKIDALRSELESAVRPHMDAYDKGDKEGLAEVLNYYLRKKYLERVSDKLSGNDAG